MLNENTKPINPKQYSPLVLAYIGDAVFEIMVREYIVLKANTAVNNLHKQAVKFVCASAQSSFMEIIMDKLSQEEIDIFKRGRNANSQTVPKNANVQDYRRATGFEALIGYLHLSNRQDRIMEIFDIIINSQSE